MTAMKALTALLFVMLTLSSACLTQAESAAVRPKPVVIRLDTASLGREFEGLGALSAGATSALLRYYPEPQRNDVLDFLFKPKFGAGFQHLKVEIGSGMNSTCGAEPSHAITPEELADPVPRGYEFWLAAEARKRNPDIVLDALPWGTPYWTKDYTTQEAADWVVAFLDCAKKHHGLDFQYVGGCQNELSMMIERREHGKRDKNLRHPASAEVRRFVTKHLRPSLDKNGYGDVQIQASDLYNGHIPEKYNWSVMKDVLEDPEFAKALDVVGYHYPVGYMTKFRDDRPLPEGFLATGKRIWAGEDYSVSGGGFHSGRNWVRKIIREYNELRITKSIAWAPFTSLPPGFRWSNVGFIDARNPWNGHYDIWPALWCVAHVTQFAEPGWRFMDTAQGRFDPESHLGVYAALKAPNGKDWSLIASTDKAVTIELHIDPAMAGKLVHVWKSDSQEQFRKLRTVEPEGGRLAMALDGKSVYTLTTTTGQAKGKPGNPIPAAVPGGHRRDDFKGYKLHDTPRYWVDQEGTFEIADHDGANVLKQVVPEKGCEWHRGTLGRCLSYFGGCAASPAMGLKTSVLIVDGFVETAVGPYRLVIQKDGSWQLTARGQTLKTGVQEKFAPDAWHPLRLDFDPENADGSLTCTIDGATVYSGTPPGKPAPRLLASIGCSYSPNMFKFLEVTPGQ